MCECKKNDKYQVWYLVCKVTYALSACLIFGFVYILLKGLWSDRAVWNILRNVLISIFHNPYLDFHISYSTFGFPYFIFHIWISIFIFHILISIFIFRIWISISRNIGWIWHWLIVSLLRISHNISCLSAKRQKVLFFTSLFDSNLEIESNQIIEILSHWDRLLSFSTFS